MVQRLPISLAQVKAGNTSENVLNGVWQIISFLHQGKEITEKVYSNMMNWIKVKYKMDTIFMHSGISKISESYRQLLNLLDKINLKGSDRYIALSNIIIYYTWINVKKSNKNNTFRISGPTWNEKIEIPDGSYSASDIQD